MVTASFCCGLFANMHSAQPIDFENLPFDLPTHISHQNRATYHHTILHNLRHYSCERVSITKLTEIATYCTSLCAVREGQSTSMGHGAVQLQYKEVGGTCDCVSYNKLLPSEQARQLPYQKWYSTTYFDTCQ